MQAKSAAIQGDKEKAKQFAPFAAVRQIRQSKARRLFARTAVIVKQKANQIGLTRRGFLATRAPNPAPSRADTVDAGICVDAERIFCELKLFPESLRITWANITPLNASNRRRCLDRKQWRGVKNSDARKT